MARHLPTRLVTVAILDAISVMAWLTVNSMTSAASASPRPNAQSAGDLSDKGRHRPVTMFVAGDSTASLWPADTAPKAGWGQGLSAFLDKVKVDDRALSGASSKSFIDVGRLDGILADIKPGDYLLISFGHNDSKTDDRFTDPATTYPEYLTRYIEGARQRHARPILVTSVERRRFTAEGQAKRSLGDYPQAMRDLGAKLHVPVVDLTEMSLALWQQLGVEGTKTCFLWLDHGAHPNWPNGVQDNTHFQAHGAIEVARLVVRDLVRQRLVPRHTVKNLAKAVPDSALTWPATI